MQRRERIPEDPPPDVPPLEALHEQRTSVFFQSSCFLPPPDEDGTTSGISGDGASSGYQPERPPPLFRLDEEENVQSFNINDSTAVRMPSASFEPHTTRPGTRHYDSYHQAAATSPPSYIGEGSFSQSYETASYPGLKILVPRLGFQEQDSEERERPIIGGLTSTVLGARGGGGDGTNHETGSILSTLSNEESVDRRCCYFVNNSKMLTLWIGALTMLIFGALAMVGTCAARLCHQKTSSQSLRPQSIVDPSIPSPCPAPLIPPETHGTLPPTMRPMQLMDSPNTLREAVDLYLQTAPDSNVAGGGSLPPIGSWDVSRIEDFSALFDSQRNPLAASFNEDLAAWDTSQATNMTRMFHGAKAFNGDVSTFDTARVTDMEGMFEDAFSFSQDLRDWDVRSVTTTKRMFRNAISFIGVGLDRWELESVEHVELMFSNALSFKGDLSSWNLKHAVSYRSLFEYTTSFDSDISAWNTDHVQDFSSMFYCSAFQGEVSPWELSRSRNTKWMFAGAWRFADNLCPWRPDMVEAGMNSLDAFQMFLSSACPSQETPDLLEEESPMCVACLDSDTSDSTTGASTNAPTTVENVEEAQTIQLRFGQTMELYAAVDDYMIDKSPYSLTSQKYGYPIGTWDVSRITNFSSLFDTERNPFVASFNEDLSSWDVSSALIFDRMFAGAAVFNGNVSSWSTSQVRSMAHMFDGATSFNGDLTGWKTEKCTDLSFMFRGASSFDGDLSTFDTASVTDTSYMFHAAHSFTGKGLSGWNVGSVQSMSSMFEEAISFQTDLASWNVSSVSDMSRSFRFATRWTSDVSGWDVSNVESFSFAFSGAASWKSDVSLWEIGARNLEGMFAGALSFNQSLCGWRTKLADVENKQATGMFRATSCPNRNDPDFESIGPFCASDCSG